VDVSLLELFDELFFDGELLSSPGKTMSAIKFFNPALVYDSLRISFPRAYRALKGWVSLEPIALSPGPTRVGFPEEAVWAHAGGLILRGRPLEAVGHLLMYDVYGRPSEIVDLLVGNLIPAAKHSMVEGTMAIIIRPTELGRPGKTGLFDETLLLRQWIGCILPVLLALVAVLPASSRLWPFDLSTFQEGLQEIANEVGTERLDVCLYSNRHGGASRDGLAGVPLDVIKQRGRWKSDGSVRRYLKSGLLLKQLNLMPAESILFGRRTKELAEPIFNNVAYTIRNFASQQYARGRTVDIQYLAEHLLADKYRYRMNLHLPHFGGS